MDLHVIADVLTCSALVLALVASAVLSVLAYLRPRRTYVWFAAGALGTAMLSRNPRLRTSVRMASS